MKRSPHVQPGGRARGLALALLALLAAPSCSSTPEPGPAPAPTPDEPTRPIDTPTPPQDDLSSLTWAPSFEPDYNNLSPHPWVLPTTKEQQDAADVLDDRLIFPKDTSPEVGDWAPGRIVVSGPGEGAGRNPLGFARRVESVTDKDGKWIVATSHVALEDLFEGDFQLRFNPSATKEVDLSKLDLAWAAENLYVDTTGLDLQAPVPSLIVNADEEPDPGAGLIGGDLGGGGVLSLSGPPRLQTFSISGALSGVGKALVGVAKDVVVKVTPKSFDGSLGLSGEINQSVAFPLFANLFYAKNITRGRFPMRFFIKGGADFAGSIVLRPGFQVGARVPNPAQNDAPSTKVWINIDSFAQTKLDLNFDLSAGIESADGATGDLLTQKIERDATMAAELYAREKEILTGDPDMRVPGGWKKNLWISRPTMQTFFAGPIPVVLVETMQVDLECGFEAQASLKGKFHYEKSHSFKFKLEAESGKKPIIEPPRYEKRTVKTVQLTGGGELTLACGLIPRVNVMVYDAVGLNAGFRGSLVAQAKYESRCTRPNSTRPTAEAAIGLYGNVGVQAGARIQVPGSSYGGKAGLESGRDIGPFELWNKQFPLWEQSWDLDGLGYCTPLCQDGKKDLLETDVDCGGGDCGSCAEGQRCKKNTDCKGQSTCNKSGVCSLDFCSDRVVSGAESDVDCGGTCQKCAVGKACRAGGDCASGACLLTGASGRCVPSTCQNRQWDAGESGVDCGGPCGKCKTGVACGKPSDCESGVSNGLYCVKDSCWDARRSIGESGVDCGGASACQRCGLGRGCAVSGDCQGGLSCYQGLCVPVLTAQCRDGARNGSESDVDCGGLCASRCARGKACRVPGDCQGLNCAAGTCGEPLFCADKRRDGDEGDVDCGGACDDRCKAEQTCRLPGDCQSGVCRAGKCAAPGCDDGVKNGAESDVDCGTLTCGLCALSKSCLVDDNCASGTCLGRSCVAAEPQSASPASGAIEIDLIQPVVVRFLRDLDGTTVNGATVTATALGSLPGTVSYADRVLRFAPTGGWPQGAAVTVTLGTGIKDKNGRPVFKAPYEIAFQTLSTAALISQWRFDDDGADASGNGHGVTLSPGGATYTASAYQGAGALRLDGAVGYGDAGAIDVGDEFSIAGWFNLDAPLRSGIHTVVATGAGGIEKAGFKVFINSYGTADGRVNFESGTGSEGILLQSPPAFVSAGRWQHFAITVNRLSGAAAMYWNGVQATTSRICVRVGPGEVPCAPGVQAQPGFTGDNAMLIGRFPGAFVFPLLGSIDDLRIYKRILTPQEVAQIASQK